MQDSPRLFTLEEASALLPVLTPILRVIQENKRHLDELQEQLGAFSPVARTNGHAARSAEIELEIAGLVQTLQSDVSDIQKLGVEVKDLDMGLVDFPSMRDERIVYLCWKVDEPEISYWHELDTGIAGRERL